MEVRVPLHGNNVLRHHVPRRDLCGQPFLCVTERKLVDPSQVFLGYVHVGLEFLERGPQVFIGDFLRLLTFIHGGFLEKSA